MGAGYLSDLDWAAVGSLATAATFVVAFYQIWVERSARKRGERQAQAQRVSGWLRPTGHVVEAADDPAPTTDVVLLNASTEPVYRTLVWLVLMQGAGPATGEEAAKLEGEGPAALSILPPGRFVAALPE